MQKKTVPTIAKLDKQQGTKLPKEEFVKMSSSTMTNRKSSAKVRWKNCF